MVAQQTANNHTQLLITLQVGSRALPEEKVPCARSICVSGINSQSYFFSYRWRRAKLLTSRACLRQGACHPLGSPYTWPQRALPTHLRKGTAHTRRGGGQVSAPLRDHTTAARTNAQHQAPRGAHGKVQHLCCCRNPAASSSSAVRGLKQPRCG